MSEATSRRSFFARVAAGTVAAHSALRGGTASAEERVAGEDYWRLVRSQFPFLEDRVPMNAANLCPSPRSVSDRVTELTLDIDRDCSFDNRAKFQTLLEASRAGVADQLGVSPDEIALVRNTSEANNTVNNGLALDEGSEVLLWDQNHPTNAVAWDVRAARFGLAVKRVATPAAPRSAQELADAFVSAFTPGTRVLSITHVSNVSGIRLPVRQITEAAHRRGIYVHVDGAQTWGAEAVDLEDLGCDSYAASAHKWLMGPKEAGVLFVRQESQSRIWPNVVAPGWGDDVDPDPKGARKFESLGQRDDACLAAIGTAVDFHRAIGPARAAARVVELATAVKTGLVEAGLRLVTPMESALSGGVCIVEVAPERRRPALTRLYAEHGIAGSTAGGLRLCPHVYNTLSHVERAIAGARAVLS